MKNNENTPPDEIEPLACLCDRKGWWITCIRKRKAGWCINLDSLPSPTYYPKELLNTIIADTYQAAEDKARLFLNTLEDKK